MVLLKQAAFLAGVASLASCNAYAEPVDGPVRVNHLSIWDTNKPVNRLPVWETKPINRLPVWDAKPKSEPKVANTLKLNTRDFSDLATRDPEFQDFIQGASKFVTHFIKRDINEREVAELAARDPNFKSFMKGVGSVLGNFVKRDEPAAIHARSEKTDDEPTSRHDSSFTNDMDVEEEHRGKHNEHNHKAHKGLHHSDHGDVMEHGDHQSHKAHHGSKHLNAHSKGSEREGHRMGGHNSHKSHSHQRYEKHGDLSDHEGQRYMGGHHSHKTHGHQHHGKHSELSDHEGRRHMGGHHSLKAHGYKHHGEHSELSEHEGHHTHGHKSHETHGFKHGEHDKFSKHKGHNEGKHGHKHLSEDGEFPSHSHSVHGHKSHRPSHSKHHGSSEAHSSSRHHKSHKHGKSHPLFDFSGEDQEMVHYKSEPHEMIRFHPRDAAHQGHHGGIHETSQKEWAQHEHQKEQEELVRHGEAHMDGKHGFGTAPGARAHHPGMGAMPEMGMHRHDAAMGPRDLDESFIY
ncbi:hypothetical protein MMC14_001108 [Varicellaria rhodocarpa]|nr:hypothetical protein [Varicellaria rhodocarpa]